MGFVWGTFHRGFKVSKMSINDRGVRLGRGDGTPFGLTWMNEPTVPTVTYLPQKSSFLPCRTQSPNILLARFIFPMQFEISL